MWEIESETYIKKTYEKQENNKKKVIKETEFNNKKDSRIQVEIKKELVEKFKLTDDKKSLLFERFLETDKDFIIIDNEEYRAGEDIKYKLHIERQLNDNFEIVINEDWVSYYKTIEFKIVIDSKKVYDKEDFEFKQMIFTDT